MLNSENKDTNTIIVDQLIFSLKYHLKTKNLNKRILPQILWMDNADSYTRFRSTKISCTIFGLVEIGNHFYNVLKKKKL
jgi:hypothetical protein